jgi:hypothetical protein
LRAAPLVPKAHRHGSRRGSTALLFPPLEFDHNDQHRNDPPRHLFSCGLGTWSHIVAAFAIVPGRTVNSATTFSILRVGVHDEKFVTEQLF